MMSFNRHWAPSERTRTALPIIIVVSTIVLVAILFTVVPTNADIPNWTTMTVGLGIGAFIAIWIFNLQAKTIEEQKKLQRFITHASLERIERYLSMAYDGMEIDKHKMASMKEAQQLSFVENLLRGDYSQSVFRVLYIVDQLQRESGFVRSYIVVELHALLKIIIERIQILYGLSPDFPKVGGLVKIERWNSICDMTLSQIEKTQKLILETLAKD